MDVELQKEIYRLLLILSLLRNFVSLYNVLGYFSNRQSINAVKLAAFLREYEGSEKVYVEDGKDKLVYC